MLSKKEIWIVVLLILVLCGFWVLSKLIVPAEESMDKVLSERYGHSITTIGEVVGETYEDSKKFYMQGPRGKFECTIYHDEKGKVHYKDNYYLCMEKYYVEDVLKDGLGENETVDLDTKRSNIPEYDVIKDMEFRDILKHEDTMLKCIIHTPKNYWSSDDVESYAETLKGKTHVDCIVIGRVKTVVFTLDKDYNVVDLHLLEKGEL